MNRRLVAMSILGAILLGISAFSVLNPEAPPSYEVAKKPAESKTEDSNAAADTQIVMWILSIPLVLLGLGMALSTPSVGVGGEVKVRNAERPIAVPARPKGIAGESDASNE